MKFFHPDGVLVLLVTLLLLLLNDDCFSSVSATVLSTAPGAISGDWSDLDVYPVATRGAIAACGVWNGTSTAFMLGGITPSDEAATDTYRYNFSRGKWFHMRTSGLATANGNLALLTKDNEPWVQRLYVFFGYSLFSGFNPSSYMYDQAKNTWSEVVISNAPAPRRGAGSWSSGSKFFVFGGATTSSFDNNIYLLNDAFTTFPEWNASYFNDDNGGNFSSSTSFFAAPSPRFGACCAQVQVSAGAGKSFGYCFGGTSATEDSNQLWIFDEEAFTWSEASNTSAPSARRDAVCAFFPDTLEFLVYGGWDSTRGTTVKDAHIHRFNVSNNSWIESVAQNTSTVPHLSLAAGCSCSSATSGGAGYDGGSGKFLVAGGADGTSTIKGRALLMSSSSSNSNNKYEFSVISPSITELPDKRYFHNSVAVGSKIYIMFGANDVQAFNDVWEYDTASSSWSQVELTASSSSSSSSSATTTVMPARFGAQVVTTGTTVYVFGGATWPSFSVVSDMVVIDFTSFEFRIVAQTMSSSAGGGIIPVRLNHVMLKFRNDIVVGTGISTSLSFATGWYKFNIVSQAWTKLSPANPTGKQLENRYGMSAVLLNDTHALVGLGYGVESFFDWFFVSLEDATTTQQANTLINFVHRVPKLNFDSDRRRVIRLFATAVLVGESHIFVCGGQTDPETPPSRATLCYHYNTALNTIFPVLDSQVPVSGATANHVADKMFVVGGRQMTNAQLLDTYVNDVQIFSFNTSDLCASGVTNDTECIFCGPGTVNAACTPVSAGYYLGSGGQPRACPAGTFLPITGASSLAWCLKCPSGTFADVPASTVCSNCTEGFICPIGSTNPLGKSTGYGAYLAALQQSGEKLTLLERNPPPYSSPTLPWFPLLFVGIVTVLLASTLAVFVAINRHVWKSRLRYFVPEQTEEMLLDLWLRHATHTAGMSETNFIEACHAAEFPPHSAHAIELQHLFVEVDSNGSTALTREDFLKCVILLIERGTMPPLKGSTALEEQQQKEKEEKEAAVKENKDGGGSTVTATGATPPPPVFETWVPAKIRDLDMQAFDMFSDSHRSGQPGDEVRNQRSWWGGLLALVFMVAVVILILAIVVNFVYSNVLETKAAVPRAVIQSAFNGDTRAVPSYFSVRVAVVGPLHTGKTLSQLKEVCVTDDKGGCTTATTVTVSGMVDNHNSSKTQCFFDSQTELCEVDWSCSRCRIPDKATFLFDISPYHSGDAIRARVYSNTGIRDPEVEWTGRLDLTGGPEQYSFVERRITPMRNSTVFTGAPATIFQFGVTSSFVEANEVEHNLNPSAPMYLASGYFVRPNGNPVSGNAVASDTFDRFHGVPVQVEVTADVTPLFVRRVFVQSSIQLIVSLLGAISGLGGGIVAAVRLSDSFFHVNPNSQRERDRKLVEEEGVEKLYEKLPKVKAEDVEDVLYLIKNGFRANVAKELVDLMNEGARQHDDGAESLLGPRRKSLRGASFSKS